jgi:hypothetical protein
LYKAFGYSAEKTQEVVETRNFLKSSKIYIEKAITWNLDGPILRFKGHHRNFFYKVQTLLIFLLFQRGAILENSYRLIFFEA